MPLRAQRSSKAGLRVENLLENYGSHHWKADRSTGDVDVVAERIIAFAPMIIGCASAAVTIWSPK